MSEFKKIETQEEFDAAISERLKRERAKFSDYDDLKKASESYSSKLAEWETKLADANERIAAETERANNLEKAANEKDAELSAAKLAKAKLTIAIESGVPIDLADRVTGSTEEEIRKDAEKMAALLHRGAPSRNPETPPVEDGVAAAFRKLNPHINI